MSQKTNVTNFGRQAYLITSHLDNTAFISLLILQTPILDPHSDPCLWKNTYVASLSN
jgi:hypothetical protein